MNSEIIDRAIEREGKVEEVKPKDRSNWILQGPLG